jgi:hypothetical protein
MPARPKRPQPGSPVAPPATMATSWAAGIIVSEVDTSYAAMCKCQHTLGVHDRRAGCCHYPQGT